MFPMMGNYGDSPNMGELRIFHGNVFSEVSQIVSTKKGIV